MDLVFFVFSRVDFTLWVNLVSDESVSWQLFSIQGKEAIAVIYTYYLGLQLLSTQEKRFYAVFHVRSRPFVHLSRLGINSVCVHNVQYANFKKVTIVCNKYKSTFWKQMEYKLYVLLSPQWPNSTKKKLNMLVSRSHLVLCSILKGGMCASLLFCIISIVNVLKLV